MCILNSLLSLSLSLSLSLFSTCNDYESYKYTCVPPFSTQTGTGYWELDARPLWCLVWAPYSRCPTVLTTTATLKFSFCSCPFSTCQATFRWPSASINVAFWSREGARHRLWPICLAMTWQGGPACLAPPPLLCLHPATTHQRGRFVWLILQ